MLRRPVLYLALLGLGCGKRLEPPGALPDPSAHDTALTERARVRLRAPSAAPRSGRAAYEQRRPERPKAWLRRRQLCHSRRTAPAWRASRGAPGFTTQCE